MTVPSRAQGVGQQGRQSPLSGSSRAWYRLCTPEWGCPLHPILTYSSHQRSDLALGPHSTEKVQQRESVWGSRLGSQLKPIQGVCLFLELLAPPGSSLFCRVAIRNQRWNLPMVQEGGLAGNSSFCKLHLLSRAGTQGPQAKKAGCWGGGCWGGDSMLQRQQSKEPQSQGREFRSSLSGTSCKPFQCLCFLAKPMRLGLH